MFRNDRSSGASGLVIGGEHPLATRLVHVTSAGESARVASQTFTFVAGCLGAVRPRPDRFVSAPHRLHRRNRSWLFRLSGDCQCR
jgi:hypothetical protein